MQVHPELHYKGMLARALDDGFISGLEKRTLRLYRESHGIREEEHRRLLDELGWTEQEYDDGVLHQCTLCDTGLAPAGRYHGFLGGARYALDAIGILRPQPTRSNHNQNH